jgi:hypothetical protein
MLRLCREHLHGGDYQIEARDYCDDALMALRQQPFDLILMLSINAPWRAWPSLSEPTGFIGSQSAIIFLDQLRAMHIRIPVLVVTQSPYGKDQALRMAHSRLSTRSMSSSLTVSCRSRCLPIGPREPVPCPEWPGAIHREPSPRARRSRNVGGSAWEPTLWRAVQQAAWTALKRPVRA